MYINDMIYDIWASFCMSCDLFRGSSVSKVCRLPRAQVLALETLLNMHQSESIFNNSIAWLCLRFRDISKQENCEIVRNLFMKRIELLIHTWVYTWWSNKEKRSPVKDETMKIIVTIVLSILFPRLLITVYIKHPMEFYWLDTPCTLTALWCELSYLCLT